MRYEMQVKRKRKTLKGTKSIKLILMWYINISLQNCLVIITSKLIPLYVWNYHNTGLVYKKVIFLKCYFSIYKLSIHKLLRNCLATNDTTVEMDCYKVDRSLPRQWMTKEIEAQEFHVIKILFLLGRRHLFAAKNPANRTIVKTYRVINNRWKNFIDDYFVRYYT